MFFIVHAEKPFEEGENVCNAMWNKKWKDEEEKKRKHLSDKHYEFLKVIAVVGCLSIKKTRIRRRVEWRKEKGRKWQFTYSERRGETKRKSACFFAQRLREHQPTTTNTSNGEFLISTIVSLHGIIFPIASPRFIWGSMWWCLAWAELHTKDFSWRGISWKIREAKVFRVIILLSGPRERRLRRAFCCSPREAICLFLFQPKIFFSLSLVAWLSGTIFEYQKTEICFGFVWFLMVARLGLMKGGR